MFAAVVLGTDAVLAAAPATHVQLTHACIAAGYHFAAPASWGDELLAMESLRLVGRREGRAVVHCTCPLVADRLLGVGDDLSLFMLSLVAPPVAVARYLRTLGEGRSVHVTYVGRCPAATDDSIDARMLPEEFLELLARRGAAPSSQPEVFDSVIPPDRRRYRSLPGGLPTAEMLWSEAGKRRLVELEGDECLTDLAQHLVVGENELIDIAPALGCACAGAGSGSAPRLAVHARGARAGVAESEPPRAASDVVDHDLHIDLQRRPRAAVRPREVAVAVGGEVAREPSVIEQPEDAGALDVRSGGSAARERARASREAGTGGASPRATAAASIESPGGGELAGRADAGTLETVRSDAAPGAPPPGRTAAERVRPAVNPPPTEAGFVGLAPPGGAERGTSHARDMEPLPRRRASSGSAARPAAGSFPVANDQRGRPLPRAYVGLRRPSWQPTTPAPHREGTALTPDESALPAAGGRPAATSPTPRIAARSEWFTLVMERLGGAEQLVRRRPGRWPLLLGILVFAIGAAFGVAAARTFVQSATERTADDASAAETTDRPGPFDAGNGEPLEKASEAAATDSPARAPVTARPVPPPIARQGVTRATSAGQVAPDDPATARGAALPEAAVPAVEDPPLVRVDTNPSPDTARAGDAAANAAAGDPVDDLAAERESIRRELEMRRARIDSIARRVDSLRLPPPTP